MTPRRLIVALFVVLALLPPTLFLYTRPSATWAGVGMQTLPVAFLFPSPEPALPADAPLRPMPLWQQYLAVGAGFGIKPLYMTLSLVPICLLRREKSPDLVALRWCCLFFFAGEAFCAINYLGFGERSYLMEYLHSLGMTLAFAAGFYAVVELLDIRLIHFSTDQGCRLGSLCRGCARHSQETPCGVRRILRLALPAMMLVAAIPLTSSYHLESYFTQIFGTAYLYIHEWPYQQYEIRFLPIAAIGLFVLAWTIAGREPHPLRYTRLLMSAGVGALGFSLFRWMLLSAFRDDQLWFAAWEELTELAAICMVLALLCAFDFAQRPMGERSAARETR